MVDDGPGNAGQLVGQCHASPVRAPSLDGFPDPPDQCAVAPLPDRPCIGDDRSSASASRSPMPVRSFCERRSIPSWARVIRPVPADLGLEFFEVRLLGRYTACALLGADEVVRNGGVILPPIEYLEQHGTFQRLVVRDVMLRDTLNRQRLLDPPKRLLVHCQVLIVDISNQYLTVH